MNNCCEHIKEKISGYLDDELTQQDSQRVHHHLNHCEECRGLYESLLHQKKTLSDMEMPSMSDTQFDLLMADRFAKTSGWIGWMLLILGVSGILGLGTYYFLKDEQISLLWKTLICFNFAGAVFILLSVLRQRLIARKTDRYKGVKL